MYIRFVSISSYVRIIISVINLGGKSFYTTYVMNHI